MRVIGAAIHEQLRPPDDVAESATAVCGWFRLGAERASLLGLFSVVDSLA